MGSRWVVVASIVLAFAAAAAAACSVSESFVDAGARSDLDAEAGTASVAWGSTECATCVRDRCRAELTRCRSEPTCARHLECVEGCPSEASGAPDPACLAACPATSGSAAERAATDVEICRTEGAGLECAACPGRVGGRRSPLLNQSCEAPSWDAGADATPVEETCTKCAAERCCESRERCGADPGCFALRDCILTCTDDACTNACNAKHDSSVAAWNELLYCNLLRCGRECGAAPGRCQSCMNEKCADEVIGCFSDHDCTLVAECTRQCNNDLSCVDACWAKYPDGVALFSAQADCARARCPACQ